MANTCQMYRRPSRWEPPVKCENKANFILRPKPPLRRFISAKSLYVCRSCFGGQFSEEDYAALPA